MRHRIHFPPWMSAAGAGRPMIHSVTFLGTSCIPPPPDHLWSSVAQGGHPQTHRAGLQQRRVPPWPSSEGKPWGRDVFLTQESPRPVPWCWAPLPARGCVVLPVPARSIAPHAASPAARERSGSQWLAPVFILC